MPSRSDGDFFTPLGQYTKTTGPFVFQETSAMRRVFLLSMGALWVPVFLFAQVLAGIGTEWSDSFREWNIYTLEENEPGELRLRWSTGNDWTEWNYTLGEHFGSVRIKWRNNPNEWEIRGDNVIVTARTLWNNDPREWRISGPGSRQFTLKCRYGNQTDEWQISDDRYGIFQMYTNWEGDPRDWVIVDELFEEVTLAEKMAMAFIVLYHSTPKE